MTANIATPPKLQFFDANGEPLVGGKLYSYAAGTTTPLATYTDSTGSTPNTNPVILDSRGEANVWFSATQYKLVLKSATDVEIWTVDNLNGPDLATKAAVLSTLAASDGSSLIGYIASPTSAVATTVQHKLRERISVFDFMTSAQIADVQNETLTLDTYGAIQAALDYVAANGTYQLFVPRGKYRLSNGLVYSDAGTSTPLSIVGEGLYASIFVLYKDADDVLTIKHATGGTGSFTTHGYVGNLGFKRESGRASISGIKLQNTWYYTFDNLDVSGFSNYGMYVYSTNSGDADYCGLNLFRGIHATNNINGFYVSAAYGSLAFGQSRFDFCDFSGNSGNGLDLRNFDGVELNKCVITTNGSVLGGGAGVSVSYNGTYSKNLVMRGCEVGNGNVTAQLYIQNLIGVYLEQNRWITNDTEAGTYGVYVVPGYSVSNLIDINSTWIVGNSITPYTAYAASGATISNSTVQSPYWQLFSTANKTKFNIPSGSTFRHIENIYTYGEGVPLANVSTSAASYAPDAAAATLYSITVGATGAFTIATPTNPYIGRQLEIQLYNASGGTITVGFDSIYKNTGFTSPTNGKRTTAVFRFTGSEWVQMGAAAANF